MQAVGADASIEAEYPKPLSEIHKVRAPERASKEISARVKEAKQAERKRWGAGLDISPRHEYMPVNRRPPKEDDEGDDDDNDDDDHNDDRTNEDNHDGDEDDDADVMTMTTT